jgi:N-acetylglucosamine malate deacetylase 1
MDDQRKCIMVIGAHAADAEIMGGAAILKHVDLGWRAVLVHATLGEKGHQVLSAEQYAAIKRDEVRDSAALLGATAEVLPYGDGELPINEEVQWQIADLIRKHRPDVLLTHWKGSFHRDHRATHVNVMESLFLASLPAFKREYPAHGGFKVYFAENWEDWDDYRPDLYLDVTAQFDRYIQAIRAYSLFRGEVSSFPYEQWYRGASELRGAMAGCARAVALMRPESYARFTLDDLTQSVG